MHIFAAANEVMLLGLRSGITLTPLKIELLVYLMHEKCIKLYDKNLVDEQFQSTKEGPRNPSLLAAFSRRNEEKSFLTWDEDACITSDHNTKKFAFEVLTKHQKDAIDCIWERYGQARDEDLFRFVTRQDSVWYKKYQPGRNRTITTEDIRSGT